MKTRFTVMMACVASAAGLAAPGARSRELGVKSCETAKVLQTASEVR